VQNLAHRQIVDWVMASCGRVGLAWRRWWRGMHCWPRLTDVLNYGNQNRAVLAASCAMEAGMVVSRIIEWPYAGDAALQVVGGIL